MKFTQAVRKPSTTGDRVFGVIIIVGGIFLCFTLIGLILGIPAIIGGIALLTKGDSLEGPCPYCDRPLTAPAKAAGVDCPACKKRSVIDGNQFRSVD